MARASADLNKIDYRALNANARTQYDTAKRFIQQADDAIRMKNLPFAKNLADKEGLALSRRQHEYMIELLRGRDNWALAQLCVDHMQYSKSDYLGRIGADQSRK